MACLPIVGDCYESQPHDISAGFLPFLKASNHVRRLMSTEYSELREKLHAPMRNATNVVIHQTISELFLDTFKAQAELNQPYMLPSEMVNIIKNMHL